jgi:hypothetical protein
LGHVTNLGVYDGEMTGLSFDILGQYRYLF